MRTKSEQRANKERINPDPGTRKKQRNSSDNAVRKPGVIYI